MGGRTITQSVGDKGREVDLGAMYIHGIGPGDKHGVCKGRLNPIYEIAQTRGIETQLLYCSSNGEEQGAFYDEDGKRLDDGKIEEAFEMAKEYF